MARIAAGEMSDSLRSQVEPLINQMFDNQSGLDDLSLSAMSAHVLLEGAKLLSAKRKETDILSTTTVFLTTLLIARKLDNERNREPVEPGGELERLIAWGSTLRGDFSRQLESLATDFFVETPTPDVHTFEDLPLLSDVEGLEFGQGLLRTLRSLTNFRVVRITDIVLRSTDDADTGLSERVTERKLTPLIEALKRVNKTSAGRATEISREASDAELALNVDDFAQALATILRTAKGEFTFALFGAWGSGKTTLTRLLRPLLESPGEYRKITGAENETFARRTYAVAYHNAWKYKAPPEAWIYIYKTLVDSATVQSSLAGRFILSVRTSHIRYGFWPIVGALLTIALLAFPIGATVQLAAISGSLIGVSAFAHIAAITPRVQTKVRELFNKHARLTSPPENLGMLALVGEDIRALLKAWTVTLDDGVVFPVKKLCLPLLVLLIVALTWGYGIAQLPEDTRHGVLFIAVEALSSTLRWVGLDGNNGWFSDWSRISPPGRGNGAGEGFIPDGAGDFIFLLSWIGLALTMTILPWLWKQRGAPNRVLLIVDDLDRCRPDEMLDVIENMKLLVDEPTLSERLQVLMLVDENVLGIAIAERYKLMIEDRVAQVGETPEAAIVAREEIITEQKEKLFACHLRVAALQDSDVAAVMSSLSSLDLQPHRQRRREAEAKRREEQAKAEREALASARENERRAEAEYERIVRGEIDEEPMIDLEEPSKTQLPSRTRRQLGLEDVLMPATEVEKQEWSRENERRKARNDAKWEANQGTADIRLENNPDIVRSKEEARQRRERAEQRVRESERLTSTQVANAVEARFNSGDVRFTSEEVDELERLAPSYFRAIRRRPSPRAIRLLLFKIQLCRLLIQMRLPGRPLEAFSIKRILRAFEKASAAAAGETNQSTGDDEIVTIAKQVI